MDSGSALERNQITDREFYLFQQLLHRLAGIHLPFTKKALLCGRLAKRLREKSLDNFGQYYDLLMNGSDPSELQTALNLLTTNETHFFRESQHFDVLRTHILPAMGAGKACRIWSAACSTGEEPYTIAMVLADELGTSSWEVLGSDISTKVLARARSAHYLMERAKDIPRPYLMNYCLKGVGAQEGTFLISEKLRERVKFRQINLNEKLPEIGQFDVIFLRNVMIYFDMEMKQRVVGRLVDRLRPEGWLIIGHSESLNGVTDDLRQELPTIYRKP